ncbi:flagellar hook-associated protein FlgL [Salinisphaera hydrothermalis]|uniref:Flagellar hook-associated protein FlgL n=1 Tax=Salinisphaera hydrothermalis (strain C41B8) TaxID=1304275 RepID=A0A084IMU1_SALHC|nr:flagellar hook-associated protein FlgL [Salinisphaera hydrothermalis]KEZ78025.1 flagellar hook-associated protein FlgL [Salinisphaera hydrothermalis C41B8]
MRLSTNTIYAQGTQSILDQQTRVSQIGEKLATGKRINKPSDDPRGAAQLLDMQQASQINDQYASTRSTAETQLSTEENQLNQVTTALDSAKQALVQASNGTLSNADRDSLANKLDGVYQQLLSAANAKDGNGDAIFAGYSSSATAFTGSPGNLVYSGDQGQRELQVDGSRRITVNDPGSSVFAATTANAKYVATADGSNSGSTTYASLDVVASNASDFGDTFKLSFSGSGSSATYSVVDQTTGNTLVSNAAYQSGQQIALGSGLQTTIKGDPTNGDSYTFAKGASSDSNILNALANTVATLRQPVDSPAAQAKLTNTINRANRQVDNSLDNVLSVRSNLGTKLSALDSLDNIGDTQSVTDKQNISKIRDVDMVSAISDFSLAKVALQAAQQTFSSVQKMSLFSQG